MEIEELESGIDFNENSELGSFKLYLEKQEIEEGLSGIGLSKRLAGIVEIQVQYISLLRSHKSDSHHNLPDNL